MDTTQQTDNHKKVKRTMIAAHEESLKERSIYYICSPRNLFRAWARPSTNTNWAKEFMTVIKTWAWISLYDYFFEKK